MSDAMPSGEDGPADDEIQTEIKKQIMQKNPTTALLFFVCTCRNSPASKAWAIASQ
jgi:hypothetical protein